MKSLDQLIPQWAIANHPTVERERTIREDIFRPDGVESLDAITAKYNFHLEGCLLRDEWEESLYLLAGLAVDIGKKVFARQGAITASRLLHCLLIHLRFRLAEEEDPEELMESLEMAVQTGKPARVVIILLEAYRCPTSTGTDTLQSMTTNLH